MGSVVKCVVVEVVAAILGMNPSSAPQKIRRFGWRWRRCGVRGWPFPIQGGRPSASNVKSAAALAALCAAAQTAAAMASPWAAALRHGLTATCCTGATRAAGPAAWAVRPPELKVRLLLVLLLQLRRLIVEKRLLKQLLLQLLLLLQLRRLMWSFFCSPASSLTGKSRRQHAIVIIIYTMYK